MTLSAAQQTALEQPVVRSVYFVELDFAGGTSRVSTLNQNLDWGGYTWSGLGALGGISPADEVDGLASKQLTFTLNAADVSWLAIALGSVAQYRGRPAKLYFCPLDEGFALIGTPQKCWQGIMDTVNTGIGRGGAAQILLKCETAAFGLKRRAPRRMNAAQQKLRHPADTGFDYLPDLIANPQVVWLSRRFQQQ